MKIVFTADTHFGSAFRGENAAVRNGELIAAFRSICNHARNIGAAAVLIGGDVFDTPNPSKETQAMFLSVLKEFSDLRFIMVAGNHDPLYECAIYSRLPQNAYVFPAEVSVCDLDGIKIYGASVTQAGDTRDPFENLHIESRDIILTHGALGSAAEFSLSDATLSDTGAGLVLTGHIHAGFEKVLSSGARLIYCGAPWGRGFDECGEKGFYEIETDTFEAKFIPSAAKVYKEYVCDVSKTSSVEELCEVISGIKVGPDEIARLVLTGCLSQPYSIETDAIAGYFPQFVSIKDKTQVDLSVIGNVSDSTLEGKFIKILRAKLDAAKDEQEREKIQDAIKQGLIALR